MPERDERIDRLEKEFSAFHSDLKYIGKSVDKMANAMESLITMQSDIRIMEERAEARYMTQKAANELLHTRIDHANASVKALQPKVEKGCTIYNILVTIGKSVVALLVTTLFGLVLWAIKMQG
jgi:predicted RNase H-like nuclease (RuvC/YqgF family)